MAPTAGIRYSREELLALRDRPGCRGLPQGLDLDDLSDLQESCFFDKSPTLDAGIYLGPQRGPGGPRAPFGAGARRAAGPAGPIHSRLIDEEERGAYQRTNSGQLTSAFGSPTKPQAIGPRAGAGPPGLTIAAGGAGGGTGAARYEDPAKMERWDSRKMDAGRGADDGWQQQKGRDNWRAGGMRASMDAGRAGAAAGGGWGGRGGEGSQPELARSGSSAPKDNGRWVRDDDDWRARKQSGALPEPRYDWSDNRAPAVGATGPGAAGGAAARGPPPGFGGGGGNHDRAPEWAEGDGGMRPRMTAADIEAERLRMQEQWKKQGGTSHGAAQSSMAELMTDDDIMSMMAEENEKQSKEDGRGAAAANGKPAAAAPHAGQHVDVAALLGGKPQPSAGPAAAAAGPGSPGGGLGSPSSAAGSESLRSESMRSRFANFFKLEESPAPSAAASADPSATGPARNAVAPAAPDISAAPGAPLPHQLTLQEQLSRAAAASHASLPPGMQRAPQPQGQGHTQNAQQQQQQQQQQSRDAGQALLAMLKQQQAAQKAAAAGGPAGPPTLPPNAVSAADVTVLEEADKVARLTALQGLDDDLLGSPVKSPPAQQAQAQLPPGMPRMPPGAMPPPPGHSAHMQQQAQQLGGGPLPHPPPPHGLPQGFPGQLPPGVGLPHHLQHPAHLPPPPHGAPFPPHGMHPMPPPQGPGGLQPPPPGVGGLQYRPPQQAPLQYRPPGVGLPPQHAGMQHPGLPQLQQQQQQQQQNALLAQLLAAQANRGPPPPQQPPQVQPGQQINLAALLGAAGNPGMQLPPMPQQALNAAQLQGLRPPAGMMQPHNMPGQGPGNLPAGISPALLQHLQMQQQLRMQQQQQPRPPMPPPQAPHQLSSAQLMAALGLAQQGGIPPQGLR